MKNSNLITILLIVVSALTFTLSPSLSTGIIIGVISLILVRIFLLTVIKFNRLRLFVPLLNIVKFSLIVLFLFITIRRLKMDALMIAIGYTIVFATTITELYINKPEEL